MKTLTGKIIAGVITAAAVSVVAVLFLFPELPLRFLGKSPELPKAIERSNEGSGRAKLTVEENGRTFNGHGIFNPLEGVEALDNDGSSIINKVAVTYVSGNVIHKKEIRYVLYTSKGERLETECKLELENYEGPSIAVKDIGTITWENLENLTELLIEKEQLTADDGFGNDVSGGVSYFYQIVDRTSVEVQFSLINSFRDYCMKKVMVTVEDIPEGVWVTELEE